MQKVKGRKMEGCPWFSTPSFHENIDMSNNSTQTLRRFAKYKINRLRGFPDILKK